MGRITYALPGLILFLFLFAAAPCQGNETGMHARIRTFRMPQYHKNDERLQFIVYGEGADNKGALLFLSNMMVDVISDDISSVKQVKLIPGINAYKLSNDNQLVRRFWSKIPHSQGLIFCETATLDKTTRIFRSDRPVQFRSEYLDIDGVGFDAYQDKRLLHIRSDVKIKLRTEPAATRQSRK